MSSVVTNYLTVQDIIWINTQLTETVQKFDFAKLEDGAFFQYGYGNSTDVIGQAGRFLAGFSLKAPFDRGNAATAFASLVVFLALNHYTCQLRDNEAAAWLAELPSDSDARRAHLGRAFSLGDGGHAVEVADAVAHTLAAYPKTLASLLAQDSHAA